MSIHNFFQESFAAKAAGGNLIVPPAAGEILEVPGVDDGLVLYDTDSDQDLLLPDPVIVPKALDLYVINSGSGIITVKDHTGSSVLGYVGSSLVHFRGGGTGWRNISGSGDITLTSPARTRSSQRIEDIVLTKPSGFAFDSDVLPVYRRGRWVGDRSVESVLPAITGTTYYVDCLLGSDLSAGTSPAAPLQTIEVALEKSDVGNVFVAPGWYDRTRGMGNPTISTTSNGIAIRPWPIRNGEVYNTSSWEHTPASWSKSTYSDLCYQASRTAVEAVLDISHTEMLWDGHQHHPHFREYVEVANSTDLIAIPGSWFDDSGTLHVHPLHVGPPDGAPASYVDSDVDAMFDPGDNIKVMLTDANAQFEEDIYFYCEGIRFIGGTQGFYVSKTSAGHTKEVIFSNCTFEYATTSNGMRWVGGEMTGYLENCIARFNYLDGFNYHYHSTGGTPNIVEVNCIGVFNGKDGTGNDNGSTVHDGINIVRIGSRHGLCEGPSVADIDAGDKWNVGVHAMRSRRITQSVASKVCWLSSTGTSWLYDCLIEEADSSAVSNTSGTVYLHNTEMATPYEATGGVFAAYVQE